MGESLKQGAKILAGVIAATAAIVGAVTGIISFKRTSAADVAVSISRTPHAPLALLDLSIVNGSYRATNLVGGEVLWHGRRVGRIVMVEETRGVAPPTAWLVLQRGRRLPLAIPAGASFAGTFVWDTTHVTKEVDAVDAALAARPVRGKPHMVDGVEIRLHFDPGKTKVVPVARPYVPDPPPTDKTALPSWAAEKCIDKRKRLRSMLLRNWDTTPEVARLTVWSRHRSQPVHTLERPVGGSLWTRFRLPELPDGRYLWAFTVEGEAVVVGELNMPTGPQEIRGMCREATLRHDIR